MPRTFMKMSLFFDKYKNYETTLGDNVEQPN